MITFESEGVPIEKLPKPVGWRLLLAPVRINEATKGGILLVDESRKVAEYFRNIAKVVAMGGECYRHPKFQGGVSLEKATPLPWCEVGDIVQYSAYTGADIIINHEGSERKFRFINDDEVVSVITDLSSINF